MNRPRRHSWRILAAIPALVIVAAGCGSTTSQGGNAGSGSSPGAAAPASLNVELDWVPNPDHVGIYYAQNKGYFTKQHLTVNLRIPSNAADPIKLVGLNKVDLAISYEPEMFYGQQEGLPVTAVAAVVPVPLNGHRLAQYPHHEPLPDNRAQGGHHRNPERRRLLRNDAANVPPVH